MIFLSCCRHLPIVYGPNLVQFEVHTSEGRADMVSRMGGHIYFFEFRVDKSAEGRLARLGRNHTTSVIFPKENSYIS